MKILYDAIERMIKVEWNEGKGSRTVRHSFSGEPSVVQLHPKKENTVIRVYFDGKIPSWMFDYQRRRPSSFKTGEANIGNGTLGWWISSWNNKELGHTMFMCPTISGAICMLAENLPDELKQYKDDLLSNIDIISLNLQFNANYFKLFGLHYRPEEIKGVAGALLIDNDVMLPRLDDESNQEYADRLESDGNLKKLITELIYPNEYAGSKDSDEEEESTDSNDSEDEIQPVVYEDEESTDSNDSEDEIQPVVYEDEESTDSNDSEDEIQPVVYEDEESTDSNDSEDEIQPVVYEDEESTDSNDSEDEIQPVVYEDEESTTANAIEEELPPVDYEESAEDDSIVATNSEEEEDSTSSTVSDELVDSNVTEVSTETGATMQEVISCDDITIEVITSTYKNAVVGQLSFF